MTDLEKEEAQAEIKRLREAINEIRELVSWHYDPAADPADESPYDTAAHVNGLVIQICDGVQKGKQ
jgi:hypothetical protein